MTLKLKDTQAYQNCHCSVGCRVPWVLESTHTHTHTRLTALCPGLSGWAGTRKVKPIWILLKQETVSGIVISWAICKFAPRCIQITMPAPHHSDFYRPDAFLLPSQQRVLESSVLFFSRPRSEGWPHHGRPFSVYRLLHGESCPRLDVIHPGRAWFCSPACTWRRSLHYLFLNPETTIMAINARWPPAGFAYRNLDILCYSRRHVIGDRRRPASA